MDTDVKALIDRMRFQLQREGLKSAVRGALSDGADALTALSADNERLTKERDEAERLHNEKCGEHHQALVAESRAGSALGRARATLREIMTFYSAALPLRVRERANDAFSPETPAAPLPISGNRPDGAVKLDPLPHAPNSWQRSRFETQLAAPSPVTDEMAEVLREALHDRGNRGVSLVAAREALTAALGRKP